MFIKQMDCTDRSTGPDIGLRLSAGLHIEELLSQEREERTCQVITTSKQPEILSHPIRTGRLTRQSCKLGQVEGRGGGDDFDVCN